VICKNIHRFEIPDRFREDDNRSYDEEVEVFIREYTKPGDTVLDIFAGLGTTLIIAEKLGRVPYGVEYLEDRFNFVISKIKNKENMIHGDARKLIEYEFPPIDLVYTSPIFMNKDETMDPLNGYKTKGNYAKYLEDIKNVFTDLKKFLKHKSHVIVGVKNLKKSHGITTLAWDIGKVLSEVLFFEGEVIIGYDGPRDRESGGYDHSYNLVFSNR